MATMSPIELEGIVSECIDYFAKDAGFNEDEFQRFLKKRADDLNIRHVINDYPLIGFIISEDALDVGEIPIILPNLIDHTLRIFLHTIIKDAISEVLKILPGFRAHIIPMPIPLNQPACAFVRRKEIFIFINEFEIFLSEPLSNIIAIAHDNQSASINYDIPEYNYDGYGVDIVKSMIEFDHYEYMSDMKLLPIGIYTIFDSLKAGKDIEDNYCILKSINSDTGIDLKNNSEIEISKACIYAYIASLLCHELAHILLYHQDHEETFMLYDAEISDSIIKKSYQERDADAIGVAMATSIVIKRYAPLKDQHISRIIISILAVFGIRFLIAELELMIEKDTDSLSPEELFFLNITNYAEVSDYPLEVRSSQTELERFPGYIISVHEFYLSNNINNYNYVAHFVSSAAFYFLNSGCALYHYASEKNNLHGSACDSQIYNNPLSYDNLCMRRLSLLASLDFCKKEDLSSISIPDIFDRQSIGSKRFRKIMKKLIRETDFEITIRKFSALDNES